MWRGLLLLPIVWFNSALAGSYNHLERVELAGDVGQVAVPLSAVYLTYSFNDVEKRHGYYKSLATTLLFTHVIKVGVNAERPNGGDYSFPSGHTAAAFSGASFIYSAYGSTYGLPAYLVASFVGWSRVEVGAHWVQDVVVGASLGVAVSLYSIHIDRQRELSLAPWGVPNGAGLAAIYRW